MERMSIRFLFTVLVAATLVLSGGVSFAEVKKGDFRGEVEGYSSYYQCSVPTDYTPKKQYSLLVWCHGAGGSPEGYISSLKTAFARKDTIIAGPKSAGQSWSFDETKWIAAVTEDIKSKYNVHPKRVFIGGHSAGGHLTYATGFGNPDLYSALIVFTGSVQQTGSVLTKAKHQGVYIVVGENDNNFPPDAMERNAQTLRDAGFDNVVFRKIPKRGHEFITEELPNVVDWLDKLGTYGEIRAQIDSVIDAIEKCDYAPAVKSLPMLAKWAASEQYEDLVAEIKEITENLEKNAALKAEEALKTLLRLTSTGEGDDAVGPPTPREAADAWKALNAIKDGFKRKDLGKKVSADIKELAGNENVKTAKGYMKLEKKALIELEKGRKYIAKKQLARAKKYLEKAIEILPDSDTAEEARELIDSLGG